MKIIVQKRDRSFQQFNISKIENAIKKCLYSLNYTKENINGLLTTAMRRIEANIDNHSEYPNFTIEEIQDIVENILLEIDPVVFESYAKYRSERARARSLISSVSQETIDLFEESRKYFSSELQLWQFFDKTARYSYEKGRRETWPEAVRERIAPFLRELSENKLSEQDYIDIENGILNLESLSSMRLVATAGPAARRDNVAIYNCSFTPINCLETFHEILYISMCGCGVGYSVEQEHIAKMPAVAPSTGLVVNFEIQDSTDGWVDAVQFNIKNLFEGNSVKNDYSKIRKAGSILKVKGGVASGPDPLRIALEKIAEIISNAFGRQLLSIEIADIVCLLGDAAVCGGFRRTAMICLFDFEDQEMRNFKNGWLWRTTHPWRENANISISLKRQYLLNEFRKFVNDLNDSGSGEAGIVSLINAVRNAPERRKRIWEEELGIKITDDNINLIVLALGIGCNPCGEVWLRTFCNLSTAVLGKNLSWEEIRKRVRLAAIIGTIQACATNFRILRPKWKEVTELERLLGVDLLALADTGFLSELQYEELKNLVIETNKEYAELLGINQSTATTVIKPGGNISVLLNTSSSVSHRKYMYGYRHVEVNINSVIYKVLRYSKVPGFSKPNKENSIYIFKFPLGTPENVKTQEYDNLDEQLEQWLKVKRHYTEHNPSVTIYFKPEEQELENLSNWLYDHQKEIGGQAFFPQVSLDGIVYDYLPIQQCSKEEYEEFVKNFPKIHWELLSILEKNDTTTSAKELACASGACAWG